MSTHNLPQINKLEYLTFCIIGVSYLWPWNSLLSAVPYFTQRLAEYPTLQKSISSSIMFISTLTSTIILIYFVSRKSTTSEYSNRVINGEITIAISFLFLGLSCVILTEVINAAIFFIFLALMIFVATFGTALSQNGSFAIVNLFEPIYIQAVMIGQAVAGILPPIVYIGSQIYTENHTGNENGNNNSSQSFRSISSFMSFLVASTVSVIALLLFKLLISQHPSSLTNPAKAYSPIDDHDEELLRPITSHESYSELDMASPTIEEPISPLSVGRKLKVPSLSIFMSFSLSMLFPVFLPVVWPIHSELDSILFSRDIFGNFALFVWNLGDLSGRLLCGINRFVITRNTTLLFYSFARFVFIPLLFLCNLHGQGGLIQSDFGYLFIQFLFGLSTGHICTSAMMRSGQDVEDHEKEAAGSFMTMAISLGLTVGSLASFILIYFL